MAKSKFVLCPRGDQPWSFRVYQTLMCNSILIIDEWNHLYRNGSEAKADILFYFQSDYENHKYCQEIVNHNQNIFKQYFLF